MVLVSSRAEINEVFDQFGQQLGSVSETKPAVQTTPKAVHTPPPRPPPVRPASVKSSPVKPSPVIPPPAAEVERNNPSIHLIFDADVLSRN